MRPVPPVVVLAFANDPERSLALGNERRAVVEAFAGAVSAGLCTIETLPDARLDDIVQAFLNPASRDRIAILHFAGHADDARLLFESTSGDLEAAGTGGLAGFLGCQRGLRLVFLNGCTTRSIASALLDAGIPAVVESTEEIFDDEALVLAATFYRALGAGAGMRRAYDEATAVVRMRRPERDGWPWALRMRPGSERLEHWTIAQEAGDPLRALPTIPEGDLPERPFRHLSPFTARDAEVFFGRGEDLRELHDRVLAPGSAPAILLYGQSGVGKSSLLEAGLLPRLSALHDVRYVRRDAERGLVGTLAHALDASGSGDIAHAWKRLEEAGTRPVTVVLDQVEESYGSGGTESAQMNELAAVLGALFRERGSRPRGKIVLGFRKEWLAEVDRELEAVGVPRARHPLGRLDAQGVVEAIEGLTRNERLSRHYGLTIEDGLADRIAREVLADRDSPAAPVIQILLAEMWDAANVGGAAPHFDTALYDRLRKAERPLDAFLGQQLASLREWNADVVDSGLALDYLHAHTTSLGTSAAQRLVDEAARYAHREAFLPGMRAQCTARYLLTDVATSDDTGALRLGHDTLAPLVRKRFEESDAPGQRARRVLESRATDWDDGATGSPLDDVDLSTVEQGRDGMRAWTTVETRLIEASRTKRAQRQQAQRRRRWMDRAGIAGLALLAVLSVVGFWNASRRQAVAESRELTQRALALDHARRDVALRLAVAAYDRSPLFEARRALFSLFVEDPYLLSIIPDSRWLTAFAADGNALVEGYNDSLFVWDLATGARRVAHDVRPYGFETYNGFEIDLSPDGTRFVGVVGIDTTAGIRFVNSDDELVNVPAVDVGVWDIATGQRVGPSFRVPGLLYNNVKLSPLRNGKQFAFLVDSGGRISVVDVAVGGAVRQFADLHADVTRLAFSVQGAVVAASTADSVMVWDVESGARLASVKLDPAGEDDIAVSPTGRAWATGMLRSHVVNVYRPGASDTARARMSGAEGDTLDGFTADEQFLLHHSKKAGEQPLVVLSLATGLSVDRLTEPGGIGVRVGLSGRRNRIVARGVAAHVWDLDGNDIITRTWLPTRDPRSPMIFAPAGTFAVGREYPDQMLLFKLQDSVGPPVSVSRPPGQPFGRVFLSRRFFSMLALDPPRGLRLDVYESERGTRVRSALLPEGSGNSTLTLSPTGDAVLWTLPELRATALQRLAPPDSEAPELKVIGDTTTADHEESHAVFSPDGSLIARQEPDRSIGLWDVRTLQRVDSLSGPHSSIGREIAFSGDGQVVAAAGYSDRIYLWRRNHPDPFRQILLSKLNVGLSMISGLALNGDGTLLAVLRSGGFVALVDVEAGDVLGTMQTRGTDFHHAMTGVAFADDGRLVIVRGDGVERIVVEPEAWANHACRVAANVRTDERWTQDAPNGQSIPRRCVKLREQSSALSTRMRP